MASFYDEMEKVIQNIKTRYGGQFELFNKRLNDIVSGTIKNGSKLSDEMEKVIQNTKTRYGGQFENTKTRYEWQSELFNKHLNDIALRTIKKGSKLSDDELKDILGPDNWKWYRDDYFDSLYNQYVSENYDALFGKEASQLAFNQDVSLLMDAFKQYEPSTMQVDPTTGLSDQYQTYLEALNAASGQQYNIAMQELDVAENQMLRSIGLSQRQMERDIAKRRQQALKSGMSTAQLAAQEQQNILAAQTGATQIAQQYADQRFGTVNQFAGASAQNYANVLGQQTESLTNAQNNSYNNLMNVWAQMYAADKYQQQ